MLLFCVFFQLNKTTTRASNIKKKKNKNKKNKPDAFNNLCIFFQHRREREKEKKTKREEFEKSKNRL